MWYGLMKLLEIMKYSSKEFQIMELSSSDTPINFSNNTGISSTSQIMTSGNNVYVVWSDQSTGDGDIYFRTSPDGGAALVVQQLT